MSPFLMMITEQEVTELVNAAIEDTNLFVVSITVSGSNAINIVIDGDDGVGIGDCKKVSRGVEGAYDREEEDFSLDVKSAGVGLPFVMPRQFRKYLNRPIEIMMNDGKQMNGIMLSYDEKEMEVEPRVDPGKGRKVKVLDPVVLNLNDIRETKSAITFK
ncbi:MAG: ribosome maturation factor RimP [Granulosicoccus sp.]